MSIMLFSNMQINGHVFLISPVKLNTEFQSQKGMYRFYKTLKITVCGLSTTLRRKDVNDVNERRECFCNVAKSRD